MRIDVCPLCGSYRCSNSWVRDEFYCNNNDCQICRMSFSPFEWISLCRMAVEGGIHIDGGNQAHAVKEKE